MFNFKCQISNLKLVIWEIYLSLDIWNYKTNPYVKRFIMYPNKKHP